MTINLINSFLTTVVIEKCLANRDVRFFSTIQSMKRVWKRQELYLY